MTALNYRHFQLKQSASISSTLLDAAEEVVRDVALRRTYNCRSPAVLPPGPVNAPSPFPFTGMTAQPGPPSGVAYNPWHRHCVTHARGATVPGRPPPSPSPAPRFSTCVGSQLPVRTAIPADLGPTCGAARPRLTGVGPGRGCGLPRHRRACRHGVDVIRRDDPREGHPLHPALRVQSAR